MSVQQTIIKGIKEQLFFNNYLVLPDFGGFVLKQQSSHFSISGALLSPPSKTVSFNSQLKQNDGVLTLWLQTKLNCTADDAFKHLKEFSEFCKSILNAKRRLSLDGIGFFYLDFENNICFEPQADSNFLTSSFGLSAVSLKPLTVETKQTKKEPVFVDRVVAATSTQETLPTKTARNYSRIVTPALLSLILIAFLAVLVSNRKMSGELRSSVFGASVNGNYSPVNYGNLELGKTSNTNKTYVADANGVAFIELEDSKILAVKVFEVNSEELNVKSLNKYEVVLGCFSVYANAKKLTKRISKDKVRAFVSERKHKGMFVVTNGQFSSKEAAAAQLAQIKSQYPNAWVKYQE